MTRLLREPHLGNSRNLCRNCSSDGLCVRCCFTPQCCILPAFYATAAQGGYGMRLCFDRPAARPENRKRVTLEGRQIVVRLSP